MGLLSDPSKRQGILVFIAARSNFLTFLCVVVGIVWFGLLAYEPLNHGTYFSENALLPGVVDNEYYDSDQATQFLRQLRKAAKSSNNRIPYEFLESKFREIGLESYSQNFTLNTPFAEPLNRSRLVPGVNVYAYMGARRSASTEALVFSSPFRPKGSGLASTTAGIALLLSLAKYFRQHSYWAKDLVFVISEFELFGFSAWLDAYHGSQSSEFIVGDDLFNRAGSIQAAINIEIPSDRLSRIDVVLEGINGHLPNLDLVNLAVRLCNKEGVTPTIHNRRQYPYNSETFNGWLHSFQTMGLMMLSHATGTPLGNHGLFALHQIEAITMRGVSARKGDRNSHSLLAVGRIMEGIFRSLNNLLERFHQSFFFYLLPSPRRYVSIGIYMPPFGVLAAALIVKALGLWINMNVEIEDEKQLKESTTSGETKDQTESTETKGELVDESELNKKASIPKPSLRLTSAFPAVFTAFCFGIVAYYSTLSFAKLSRAFRLPADDAILAGFTAVFVCGLSFPRALYRRFSDISRQPDERLVRCLGLMIYGFVVGCTSLMNISLAFLSAAILSPVFLIIHRSNFRLVNFLQAVLLVVVSPLALLMYSSIVYYCLYEKTNLLNDFSNDFKATFNKITERAESMLITGVTFHYFFGQWILPWVCFFLFPTWLIFWSVLWLGKY